MSSNQSQSAFSLSQGNSTSFNNAQTPPNYGVSSEEQEQGKLYLAFSGDESRALKECRRESFYYRCIPLSTLLSGLAFIGMKNGYLQKSPKYGYIPKIVGAAFLGYIGGKYSYRKECLEKIMKLPNSRLAEIIRKNQGQGTASNSLLGDTSYTMDTSLGEYTKENLMLEERKPDFSEHNDGADSLNKVTENLSPYTEGEMKNERSYISYEELRKRNRDEYKINEKYSIASPTDPDRSRVSNPDSSLGFSSSSTFDSPYSSPLRPRDNPSTSSPGQRPEPYLNPKRNKYGDLWDD